MLGGATLYHIVLVWWPLVLGAWHALSWRPTFRLCYYVYRYLGFTKTLSSRLSIF